MQNCVFPPAFVAFHASVGTFVPISVVVELAAALDAAGVDHRRETYGAAPRASTMWGGERLYRPQADLAS